MHILMRRCMIRDDFGIFIQLHLNLDTIRAAPQAFKCPPLNFFRVQHFGRGGSLTPANLRYYRFTIALQTIQGCCK